MLNNLINNLTKRQKIIIGIILQLFIIISLVATVNIILNTEKVRTFDADGDSGMDEVPDDLELVFREQLWSVVSTNVEGLDKSELSYSIRKDSYSANVEDGVGEAVFLVDVDSVKQTYRVSIVWSEESGSTPDDIVIDCPRKDEMKYPETVCHGMYNDSYSLDLYLPQDLIAVENGQEHYYGAVYEGENTNEIDAVLLVCDLDKARKLADDYLGTIPLDLSSYKINYEIMKDVDCLDDFDEEDDDDE